MTLKTKGLKFTIILTNGFILLLSALFALITWYLAPVLFPEVETQRKNNSPSLTSIELEEIGPDGTANFNELKFKVWTEPRLVKSNEQAELFLEILSSSGKTVSLDTSIHDSYIHTYAIRSDLGVNTLHLHPSLTKKEKGIWRTLITFPSPGVWYLVNQTAKGGTVYHVTSTFEIEGKQSEAFTPDFSKNKEVSDWNVILNVSNDPILVGQFVQFTFDLEPKLGTNPPKLEGGILDNGHNLILSRLDDSFIWNQHGDSSVEEVSEQAGITAKRVSIEEHPFAHTVIFPKPGIWLLHFEIESNPVHFFVNVGD